MRTSITDKHLERPTEVGDATSFEFPRANLPQVPTFSRSTIVSPNLNEPSTAWRNPLPALAEITLAPSRVEATYDPLQLPRATDPATVVAARAPSPDIDQVVAPLEHGQVVADEVGPGGISRVPVLVVLVSAALLAWASHMAFSAALLSIAALFVMHAAQSLHVAGIAAGRALAAVALVMGAVALWRGFGQFSTDAFVAGLFVLIAALPLMLVMGGLQLWLRRHAQAGGDEALLRSGMVRIVVLGLVLITGAVAHRTFNAKPDAVLTVLVNVHVASLAFNVLRGRTRGMPATS